MQMCMAAFALQSVCVPEASAAPGSLLEIYNLGPCPRLTELELHFNKPPADLYAQ